MFAVSSEGFGNTWKNLIAYILAKAIELTPQWKRKKRICQGANFIAPDWPSWLCLLYIWPGEQYWPRRLYLHLCIYIHKSALVTADFI